MLRIICQLLSYLSVLKLNIDVTFSKNLKNVLSCNKTNVIIVMVIIKQRKFN